MITRIITGVVLVAVALPVGILGGWFVFVLLLFLALVGSHELLEVPGPKKFSLPIRIITYTYVLLLMLSFFIKPWANGSLDAWFMLDVNKYGSITPMFFLVPILLTLVYFFSLFFIAIRSEKVELADVTFLVVTETFMTYGFLGMLFLRYFPNATGFFGNPVSANWFSLYYQSHDLAQNWSSSILIFALCFGTWFADIGAYFVGVLFGKHKMNERISPNKTWEGFIGGCLFSYLFFFGGVALFEFVFDMPLVPGLLQFGHSEVLANMNILGGNAWVFLVLIGLLLPFIGNLGGFLFSLIKRHYGIKDYGKIFPGHGGVIDRFDSVLANSLSTGLLLLMMSFGFNMIA